MPTTLKTCTTCGRTIPSGTRCAQHQRPRYDQAHRAKRAQLMPQAIGTSCPICQQPMTINDTLDLDHTTSAIVHATCNRSNTHAHMARRGVGA